MKLRLASWNVNGLRALAAKDDWQWFARSECDVIALQETKASAEQLPEDLRQPPGYAAYFSASQVKKGYSGTAVFSRLRPLSVEYELPDEQYRGEGRIIHLEFEHFHFFNGYFPNGGAEITDEQGRPTGEFKRVPYKMGFFACFFDYVQELRRTKPIVVCGDFNIAHQPIDLARPRANVTNTGFLPLERAFLDKFTQAGYIDTFRLLHPGEEGHYSWWSYKARARAKNIGWRIDYFFVSAELRGQIREAYIENEVYGSDHCPVGLVLEL